MDRVGYGATQLVESGPQRARDHAAAVALLRRTVELGVDHFVVSEWGLREGALLDAISRL